MPQMYYIVPVPTGPVDPGWGIPAPPGQPSHPWVPPGVGIWPSPGHPAHPIAPGGPPWGGGPVDPGWGVPGPGFGGPVDPGWGVPGPGRPPGSVWPGVPTHPIVIPPVKPGDPPTIWPSPGTPTHPIVLPPEPPPTIWPDPPGKPPGGETGSPTHPINLPPASAGGTTPGFWSLAYFAELNGWVWVWVPVPTPPDKPQPKR